MLWSLLFLVWNLLRLPNTIQAVQAEQQNNRITTIALSPQPTPTIEIIPTITNSPTPTTTPSPTPIKIIRSTPILNTLLPEINAFRNKNGLSSLLLHNLLCSIAQKRVTELIGRGSLDNHQGIQKYTGEIFKTFSAWSEVIFSSSPPQSNSSIVENGWANSPPHRQAILTQEFTNGCGSSQNGFAVFLLAKKK